MGNATLSNLELQAMGLLERSTGAVATDVVFTDNSVIFVLKTGDLGKAIGKQGQNIRKLEKLFGKDVQVVEGANGLEGFVGNLFYPAKIIEVKSPEGGARKVLLVKVEQKSKGMAIGNGGEKIKRARVLLKRHYSIDEVKIV